MTLYHHEFKSTMLETAAYDSETQELIIVFNGGRSYTYKEVSINTYTDLIGAKSPGGYFNTIKKDLVQK